MYQHYKMNELVVAAILISLFIGLVVLTRKSGNNRKLLKEKLEQISSDLWRQLLNKIVVFYAQLDDNDKRLFEKRIQSNITTIKVQESLPKNTTVQTDKSK